MSGDDTDPMLGTPEEQDNYVREMMQKMQDEATKDREAVAQQRARLQTGGGVSDVGTPVLLGGVGMQNAITSAIPP